MRVTRLALASACSATAFVDVQHLPLRPRLGVGIVEQQVLFIVVVVWAVVFVGVLIAMLLSLLRHPRGAPGGTGGSRNGLTVEVIWSVVPLGVVVVMIMLALQTAHASDEKRAPVKINVLSDAGPIPTSP